MCLYMLVWASHYFIIIMNKRQTKRINRVRKWLICKTAFTESTLPFYIDPCHPSIVHSDLMIAARASIADLEIKANPSQKVLKQLVLTRLEHALFSIRDHADGRIHELEALRGQL